jgi:hypothetical protein
MPGTHGTPLERLMRRVVIDPITGCWIWTGQLSKQGYGAIGIKIGTSNTMIPVHRLSYEINVGPIPPGMTLDHICHDPSVCHSGRLCPHRRCCNPNHLKLATGADNARRGWRGNKPDIGLRNRIKTVCPRGHPYSLENTSVRRGRRNCRECHRIRERERDRRLRPNAQPLSPKRSPKLRKA